MFLRELCMLAMVIVAITMCSMEGEAIQVKRKNNIRTKEGDLYPKWAHKHWVWLSRYDESQEALLDMVEGFKSRDIPVGGVNMDSSWSTGYSNFVVDKTKFPDMKTFIQKLHDQDIKVLAWATSMVNEDASNYKEGHDKGYFMNSGLTVKWWHGVGSFVDYTNPEAVQWWHKQMDNMLDIGLDGWKCDGTDPYIQEFIFPHGKGGYLSAHEYGHMYYNDFFYYTKSKNPNALIMARPTDSFRYKDLIAVYYNFQERDTSFSAWVGDQDPTFEGMKNAIANFMHSAWNNYINIGSDIGGYRSGHFTDPREKKLGRSRLLFIRWSQMGAICSLMENGGNGEHRPWIFDEAYGTGNETVDIYRKFVHLHEELQEYFFTTGNNAYHNNISTIQPVSKYSIQDPFTWGWKLGEDIFTYPVLSNTSIIPELEFPKDSNVWVDYFEPSKQYQGGSILKDYKVPLDRYPIFKRAGSILPLRVQNDYVHHGNEHYINHLNFHVTGPLQASGVTKVLNGPKVTKASYKNYGARTIFTISPSTESVLVTLRMVGKIPKSIFVSESTTRKLFQRFEMAQSLVQASHPGYIVVPHAIDANAYDIVVRVPDITSGHEFLLETFD